jgi:long-chain acyl-CoA synthetase
MDRFWLKNYPPGVPADIDPSAYPSVVDLIEESFARYGDAKAYTCLGTALSFTEVDTLSRALAAWLQGRGLAKSARVAIMMPNVLQYPIAVAAVLRAGFIAVNVDPLYTTRELAHQLGDSGAEAVIVLDNFAATLQQALRDSKLMGAAVGKNVIVGSMGDFLGFPKGLIVNFVVHYLRKLVPAYSLPGHSTFSQAIAEGRRLHFERPMLGPQDVAVLQYTGGTTGVAKGATLLHRTIVANLLASEAWMQPGLRRKKLTGQFNIVCALPLYHVFAFITCGLLGMRTGALNILIPDPRDIKGTIRELARHRINIFPGVNTLFNALASRPEFADLDFSGLAITNGGGMAVQEAVAKKWLAVTGCAIVEGYGLSETSAGVTCNPTDSNAFTGTIGLPLPSVEIRILDDNGNDVPLGEAGEIAIRGPQVMQGYWRQPDETAKVMTADGFFKSGDVGVMDQRGFVKIVDRKKDMIVVSGFKVYPNEIEAVVASQPGVLECAAVGVPDAKSGEAVMLFVVRRDPKLTREALRDYCEQQFTGYKRPKYIEFRDELPKTNAGKILRRELRDGAMEKAA